MKDESKIKSYGHNFVRDREEVRVDARKGVDMNINCGIILVAEGE